MNSFFTITVRYLAILLIVNCCVFAQEEIEEPVCSAFYDANVYGDYDPEETSCNATEFDFKSVSKYVDYWLYTRQKPEGELLQPKKPNILEGTSFNMLNPIKVVVHGYMGDIIAKESVCENVMKAYLHVGEYNVICVKWTRFLIDINYINAKLRVKGVGYDTAEVLNMITGNMQEGVENLHLIGHSLGAHIVGFAGKKLKVQIPRITGLDPAKPLYRLAGPHSRIDKTDAKFVDIIHSNAKILGLFGPLGHVDFYPNGGKTQPQCVLEDIVTFGACSHLASIHYYTQSILVKNSFESVQCDTWKNYKANKCDDKSANKNHMGEYVDQKSTGKYFLTVTEPYI